MSRVPGCHTLVEALAAIGRLRRARGPVALLVVPAGGRAPGDAACAALCRQLRASVRAGDPICWLGQMGFAIVLLGATPSGAAAAASRVGGALDEPVMVFTLAPGEESANVLVRLCAGPVAVAVPRPTTPAPPIVLLPLARVDSPLAAPSPE